MSVSDLLPIPLIVEATGSEHAVIADNGEPLVALPVAGRLRGRSLYAELGIPEAPTVVSVRKGVRVLLEQVAESLPEGIGLVVFDGYRPLSVQRYLYETFAAEVATKDPNLSADEVDQRVRQFVAAPVADPHRPPPHRTGGATDVYLVYLETGAELPMGTEADEISPLAVTRYFEETPQEPFTSNRRLLWHAMTAAGFANYPGEWWHYEYGTRRWANQKDMAEAIYGLPGDAEAFTI